MKHAFVSDHFLSHSTEQENQELTLFQYSVISRRVLCHSSEVGGWVGGREGRRGVTKACVRHTSILGESIGSPRRKIKEIKRGVKQDNDLGT